MTVTYYHPAFRGLTSMVAFAEAVDPSPPVVVWTASSSSGVVALVDVSSLSGRLAFSFVPTTAPEAMAWKPPWLSVWSREAVEVYRVVGEVDALTAIKVLEHRFARRRDGRVTASAATLLHIGLSGDAIVVVDLQPDVPVVHEFPYRASYDAVVTSTVYYGIVCESGAVGTVVDVTPTPRVLAQFPASHVQGPLVARSLSNGFVVGSASTNMVSVFIAYAEYRADEPPVSVLSHEQWAMRVRDDPRFEDMVDAVVALEVARRFRAESQVETLAELAYRHGFPVYAWERSPIVDFARVPVAEFRADEPADDVLVSEAEVFRYRVGEDPGAATWAAIRKRAWVMPITHAVFVRGCGTVLGHGEDGAISWRHSVYAVPSH